MNKGREEKSVIKTVEEVIVSHAWREKVGTLIKKWGGLDFPSQW